MQFFWPPTIFAHAVENEFVPLADNGMVTDSPANFSVSTAASPILAVVI